MSARLAALALGTSIIASAANAQESPSSPLEGAVQANEIVVFGRLSSDDIFDIPQSVEVLGGDVIRDTRSETLGDVLRLLPGASRDGSVYDVFGDSFLIRGFPANQTVNGMTANALRQARDTISISRVEVLKGPASVLYGQLQPGAVVNVVTKQPERTFAARANMSFGRFDNWRTTLDLTGPITADGNVRFRLAGAYDNADSIIDYWHREHFVVAPSLAFDLGTTTTVTLEGLYARNKLAGFLNGLPAQGTILSNPNGRLADSLGLADPTFDPSIRVNKEITARIDHRFSEDVKARIGLSWTREDTDEEGVFGLLGWDEEFRSLTRAVLTSRSDGDAWTAYADLAATVQTGPIHHELVIGADHSWLDRDNLSEVGLASSLDLYAPEYELQRKPETFPVPSLGSASVERNRNLGIFAQDRIALTENLRAIGGLRWSRYRQRTTTTLATGERFPEQQSQTAWTSQIGLLFNPIRSVSLFVNRTSSFLPVSGVTSDGRALEPETGVQYEVGARARVLDGALTLEAALFHLKRGNVAVSDRDDPSALISIGEQVSKGVELSLQARPAPGLDFYAGYALTDAETTEDTNAGLIGKRIRNVPRHSFSLRTSYEIQEGGAKGLRVGGTGTYTGDRAGDLEDSFELPGYWRFDGFAQYPINDVVSVGASVENLTNRRYYSHAYSLFEVWPGAPRTWKVDLTTRF